MLNFIIPSISNIFDLSITIVVYALSILGAVGIILVGALMGICFIITIINILISITYKLCKRIRK